MPHQLLATITELAQTQQELLQCSQRKKDALVNREIDELAKIVKEEAVIIRRMGKLEEERHLQLMDFYRRQGIQPESKTVTELNQMIEDPKIKNVLEEKVNELITTTKELQDLNELNTKLIEDSLSFVTHSLEVLTGQDEQQMNYQKPQHKGEQKQATRNFFDKKA